MPEPARETTDRFVRGVVLSRPSGQPIRGALVACAAGTNAYVDFSTAFSTPEDGTFQISVPAGGTIAALAEDHVPWTGGVSGEGDTEQVIRMEAGDRIRGMAVGPDGRPVEGVRVGCHLPEVTYGWPHLATALEAGLPASPGATDTTEGDGRFTLQGLTNGQEYRLRAAKEGWAWHGGRYAGPVERVSRAGDEDVRIRMTPAVLLEVAALDETTNQRVRGRVFLQGVERAGLRYAYWTKYDDFVNVSDPASPRDTLSAVVRYHLIPAAEDGGGWATTSSLRLTVDALGYERITQVVQVQLGSVHRETVRLKRAQGPWARLAIRAVMASGTPFNGRLGLWCRGEGGKESHQTLEFVRGESAAIDLPPATLRLLPCGAGKEGGWWGLAGPAVSVELGSDHPPRTVTLVLSGGRVVIRAKREDGLLVRGYGLDVRRADSTQEWPYEEWDTPGLSSAALPSGAEPYVWLPPGEHKMEILHPRYRTCSQYVVVPSDGASVEVTFELARR